MLLRVTVHALNMGTYPYLWAQVITAMQAPSSTCKYYTSHGSVRGLHKKCNPPEKFGTWAWQQICKGLHPKKKEITEKLE